MATRSPHAHYFSSVSAYQGGDKKLSAVRHSTVRPASAHACYVSANRDGTSCPAHFFSTRTGTTLGSSPCKSEAQSGKRSYYRTKGLSLNGDVPCIRHRVLKDFNTRDEAMSAATEVVLPLKFDIPTSALIYENWNSDCTKELIDGKAVLSSKHNRQGGTVATQDSSSSRRQ